jgi:hypothetical protein
VPSDMSYKIQKKQFLRINLQLIYPVYLPEGYAKVYEDKSKTEIRKDSITIHYYNKKTDSFIFLAESNGPLAPEVYEVTPRQISFNIGGIVIKVNNPINQGLKNRPELTMDARWIYKGQCYNIQTDAIPTSELEKIVESMIK